MMKLLRNITFILFFITFFSYCGKKDNDEKETLAQNSDIISSEEMVLVLEDVYLAEGAISRKDVDANNPQYYATKYYDFILKKHNLTNDQFMASYTYYSSDAEEMVKILEVVINDLSQKQGLLQGNDVKKGSGEKIVK